MIGQCHFSERFRASQGTSQLLHSLETCWRPYGRLDNVAVGSYMLDLDLDLASVVKAYLRFSIMKEISSWEYFSQMYLLIAVAIDLHTTEKLK